MPPKLVQEGFLPEQDGHEIYFAQYGNPDGPAIVSLHGGPGSKSKAKHIQGYDLDRFQAIIFDQRGCGKSTPLGEVKDNTTQKLIEDIERLREHLNIDTWFVSGSSWGSTLALLYAETHPDKVRGLLLSAIFLARPRDIEWALTKEGGIDRMFPDVWEKRMEFLKKYNVTPDTMSKVLLEKLLNSDDETIKDITAGVENWESNLMSTLSDVSYVTANDVTPENTASARLYLHYEMNHYFIEPDQILHNIDSIKSIPTAIVHGRYDLLCPVESMWTLSKQFEDVRTVILPSSAHALTPEGNVVRSYAFNDALKDWTGTR